MPENQEKITIQKPQRPEGLTLVCVLSFIGGGLSFVSNFFIYAFYSQIIPAIENGDVMQLPNVDMDVVLEILKSSGRIYYLFISILYLISLYGVNKMWHLQKRGIHFYAIAQIVMLILPLLFVNAGMSVLPGLLITVLFIFIYSRYLNIMQ